jgi:hypothetical protein
VNGNGYFSKNLDKGDVIWVKTLEPGPSLLVIMGQNPSTGPFLVSHQLEHHPSYIKQFPRKKTIEGLGDLGGTMNRLSVAFLVYGMG